MLKHFVFGVIGQAASGRVAVKAEDGRFVFGSLWGAAPPAWVLGMALSANEEIVEAANDAALTRKNDYAIVSRTGMSGSRDFRLIERRDDDMADYPTKATLHVSKYGKLNQGVRMWIGDLAPVVAEMLEKCPDLFIIPEGGYILEKPIRQDGIEWRKPASKLLAIDDTGHLCWDNTDGAETITAEMPLWLENTTLERLREGDTAGTSLENWQIEE